MTDIPKKKIRFTKMHGIGNDYIYIDIRKQVLNDPKRCAQLWCDRHCGIGADGIVLIGDSQAADFSMRIFNADGSEAEMCGNACRCVGKYVYEKGFTKQKNITIETLSGIKSVSLCTVGNIVRSVTVEMGIPTFHNKDFVATEDGSLAEGLFELCGVNYKGTFVCIGNPHLVIFVNNLASIPLEEVGPILEHHPLFPQRCNIEFAEFISRKKIRARVWERGSGITQACGTGACATAVVAILQNKTEREVDVILDGGELSIQWSTNNESVFMSGPAQIVFEGMISIP